jgi:hypothetical protein
MKSTRRKSLGLVTASAVAAAFGVIAPQEALAAGGALKVKKAKVATVTLELFRVGDKGRTSVATINLSKVAENLQKLGSFEITVRADRIVGEKGIDEKPVILAQQSLTVEKD